MDADRELSIPPLDTGSPFGEIVRRLELGLSDGVSSSRTHLLISFISPSNSLLTSPGSLSFLTPVIFTWSMLERIDPFERGDDFGRLDLPI
jgi:hypothetical protein